MNNTAEAANNATDNIELFAHELSILVDQVIRVEDIYVDKRIYFYIQKPMENSPMLLDHYRGGYVVNINSQDLKKIKSGEISPSDYIRQANWLVGYFWGNMSMIGGGYYQPMKIVDNREEVQRYLKILDCRGTARASHYMPSKARCKVCPVIDCYFSEYKTEKREDIFEFAEYEPRMDLFKALMRRFEREYPGYTFRGFLCSENIADDQIFLSPNSRYTKKDPLSFLAYASDNVIRSLLMKDIKPENWDEYAATFNFVMNDGDELCQEVTPERLAKVAEENDYTKKREEEETISFDSFTFKQPAKKGVIATIVEFFKNIF